MSQYRLPHHQLIEKCLHNFDSEFLKTNHILFGGGTRISLEIDEYRESVDIDFLCQDKQSYRAVREQVTNQSLGTLVYEEFKYFPEIRFNRDAVRTFLLLDDVRIKLEFVCFDNYELVASEDTARFPVPFIDHVSCFYTKLLANTDRAGEPPYKDIIDILAMIWKWGDIPETSLQLAKSHYGKSVDERLRFAVKDFLDNGAAYQQQALDMELQPDFFKENLLPTAGALFSSLS